MARGPTTVASQRHPLSLAEDIVATGNLRTRTKKRKSWQRGEGEEEDGAAAGGYVDAKASRKILRIGRELAAEEEEEEKKNKPNPAFEVESRFDAQAGEDEDEDEDEDEEGERRFGDEGEWEDEEDAGGEAEEIDPKDLETFNKFLPHTTEEPTLDLHAKEPQANVGGGVDLADLILKQIEAHESMQSDQQQSGVPGEQNVPQTEEDAEMSAKVFKVYSTIGQMLSRYKSGKLPKPFKILPTVPHWEELLDMTRPEDWTPNACYEATRIFVSSNPKIAQRFLELVILERVRADIYENRKLNVHLFDSLKKSTYKPAAFFKGILFPLVESGSCTLREAHIISGVLTRCSIPPLHAAAALMRLTDIAAEQASQSTEGGGATNILLRALLDKKYALPYKVVDNLVFHFLRFRAVNAAATTERGGEAAMTGVEGPGFASKLPVLWHQSLLAFAQRYRNDITEDQREALLDLLLIKGHREIGPEVRRELLQGRGRGMPLPEEKMDGGDDTMMLADPV